MEWFETKDFSKITKSAIEVALIAGDILKSGYNVSQIAVEFHHRFHNMGADKTRNIINKLNKKGYNIFYISESGEEYSFLKN